MPKNAAEAGSRVSSNDPHSVLFTESGGNYPFTTCAYFAVNTILLNKKSITPKQTMDTMEWIESIYQRVRNCSLVFNPEFKCPNCEAEVDHRYENCQNCGRQLL